MSCFPRLQGFRAAILQDIPISQPLTRAEVAELQSSIDLVQELPRVHPPRALALALTLALPLALSLIPYPSVIPPIPPRRRKLALFESLFMGPPLSGSFLPIKGQGDVLMGPSFPSLRWRPADPGGHA